MSTLAQEELDRYLSSATESKRSHPDDHSDSDNLSAHEDNYPADGPDGDDTNHEMAQTATSLSVAASRTYHIPYKQFDANTGPKGVIADAQSYSRAKQSTFRKAFANITNTFALSKASTGSAITEKQNYSDSSSASDVDGEVTVLGEEEDEDFMREWRAKRLAELSSQHTTGSINGHGSQRRRVSPSKRTWGYLEDVDANGYLDAIEKVGNDVVVVVLIYDSGSAQSASIESSLETLAQRYPTTRFVKLHQDIAEMTHVDVPAVIAYRRGDVFATLSGCRGSFAQLEAQMAREGILL